jgi:hypothetical protein
MLLRLALIALALWIAAGCTWQVGEGNTQGGEDKPPLRVMVCVFSHCENRGGGPFADTSGP